VHDSVTVHMAAPPEQVWDLVSDVTRIGSYSPETFEAEWIEGATGPAVGARCFQQGRAAAAAVAGICGIAGPPSLRDARHAARRAAAQ